MDDLKNKVAIITGASSGIGRAASLQFARAGARLVLSGRRQLALEKLEELIGNEGGQVRVLAGDVCDAGYHQELVATALGEFGGLDIAFNNAGMLGELEDVASMSLENWQSVISTNLTAAFLGAHFQIPALRKSASGSLIFTSSFVGYTAGMPGMAAYGASKAGVVGLVKSLAVELATDNIRVNALLPGGTDTPMAQSFANSPEAVDFVNGIHALGRQAAPEEIARSVLYLASDMSSFTTGSALLVDGGVSVKRG